MNAAMERVGDMTHKGPQDICELGAVGDGATDSTMALQRAIDRCGEAGGGVVRIPAGIFRTGTLWLRSGVCLDLDAGAELRAIESLDAFPAHEPPVGGNYLCFMRHALIYAEKAVGIGLRGQGTINGMGGAPAFARRTDQLPGRYMNRPSVIRFVDCRNVRIENVQIRDSAQWTMHLMACSDVVIHGITLRSRSPNYNNDGIDVDSCEDVRISDCFIDSEDDAISIKATTARPCRRVMVTNCILSTHCNAIRVGCENFGTFEDLYFSNLHVYDSQVGIAMQNTDGHPMRRIAFNNLSLQRVAFPIHVITNRNTYPCGLPIERYPAPMGPAPAAIEDVRFEGVTGREIGCYEGMGTLNQFVRMTCRVPCLFSGHPDAPLRNLTLRNMDLEFIGGGSNEEVAARPERINDFTNVRAIHFPAYGMFLRHVRDALVSDVRLRVKAEDRRPAVLVEHSADVDFDRLVAQRSAASRVVRWHDAGQPHCAECQAIERDGRRVPMEEGSGLMEQSTEAFSAG